MTLKIKKFIFSHIFNICLLFNFGPQSGFYFHIGQHEPTDWRVFWFWFSTFESSKNIAIDLNLRTETMAKANSEPKIDYAEIYTASDTFDCSAVFHTIYDVVGFVLYMHQQIPSYVLFFLFETPIQFSFILKKSQ